MTDKTTTPPVQHQKPRLDLQTWTLPAVALLCAFMSLARGLQFPMNDDDVYHLHSIWLTSHGAIPYREFFEFHFPGMWLMMAPLGWLAKTPAALFLAGRVIIALLFGGTVFLVGSAVKARGLVALFLGFMCVLIMERCSIYVFRAEYVASFFIFLHIWLLSRSVDSKDPEWPLFFAALVIGVACTMSIRPIVFLPLQPLLALLLIRRVNLTRHMLLYCLGFVVGVFPCFFYLSCHHLIRDAFAWSFGFTSSGEVVKWSKIIASLGWRRIGIAGVGLTSSIIMLRWARLQLSYRVVLFCGWLLGLFFFMIDPHKIPFAYIHFMLLCAMVVCLVPGAVLGWLPTTLVKRWQRRLTAAGAVLLAVAIFGFFLAKLDFKYDRSIQRQQLQLVNWLHQVAGDRPVVLVGPHHTMISYDATDVNNSWHYVYWIYGSWVRDRLPGTTRQFLTDRPAVIAADPWFKHCGKRDMIEWLTFHGGMTPRQADRIRDMIRRDYVQVVFPGLEDTPYGHTFWVQSRRLQKEGMPKPSRLEEPTFTRIE